MSALEKKLVEEKKQRTDFQQKLEAERKNKKEANAERVSRYHNRFIASYYKQIFADIELYMYNSGLKNWFFLSYDCTSLY